MFERFPFRSVFNKDVGWVELFEAHRGQQARWAS